VPVIERGDLDAGDLLAVLSAVGDVLQDGVAVRADEVSAQALPDDVIGPRYRRR
jgi:hypothetical protein